MTTIMLAFKANFTKDAGRSGRPMKNKFRLRHADGAWRHIESVGVNRFDDPGIRGIIINCHDVTESKRAEESLREGIAARLALEDQLRQAQKMEAIGRLAGGVAHDFNNVLTAILGSADLLSMMLEPDDPKWAEADAIKRAADRGAGLTKRLLSFSRPPRAAATVVDLVSVVSNIEPMLRRLVLDKIAISVTASHVPILVRADDSALSQILLNLVVNARDAMPNGGTAYDRASGVIDSARPHRPATRLSSPASTPVMSVATRAKESLPTSSVTCSSRSSRRSPPTRARAWVFRSSTGSSRDSAG